MLSHLATIVLAESGGEAAANPITSLIPFLLIGLVFYFLIIRPQRKRQQEQKALLSRVGVGDEIVTIGGFHGEIVGMTDDTLDLQLAPGVVVTIARNAVSRTLTEPAPVMDDEDEDDDLSWLDDEDEFTSDDDAGSTSDDDTR